MDARDIRTALNLTQQELGVANDLSDRTVRDFESGRLTPTFKTKRKLAAAYRITVEQVDSLCRGDSVTWAPVPVADVSTVATSG